METSKVGVKTDRAVQRKYPFGPDREGRTQLVVPRAGVGNDGVESVVSTPLLDHDQDVPLRLGARVDGSQTVQNTAIKQKMRAHRSQGSYA
jgi:hypothetical protein